MHQLKKIPPERQKYCRAHSAPDLH